MSTNSSPEGSAGAESIFKKGSQIIVDTLIEQGVDTFAHRQFAGLMVAGNPFFAPQLEGFLTSQLNLFYFRFPTHIVLLLLIIVKVPGLLPILRLEIVARTGQP